MDEAEQSIWDLKFAANRQMLDQPIQWFQFRLDETWHAT
jgi:hypothetical protein